MGHCQAQAGILAEILAGILAGILGLLLTRSLIKLITIESPREWPLHIRLPHRIILRFADCAKRCLLGENFGENFQARQPIFGKIDR
jgi:hypothetical protein